MLLFMKTQYLFDGTEYPILNIPPFTLRASSKMPVLENVLVFFMAP